MQTETLRRAKLVRTVRYGGVALVAAWSLLAILAYAASSELTAWLARMPGADGWIAWSGSLFEQTAGPAIVVIWLVGTLAVLALAAALRRLAA
jgi:hypothetical protein